MTSFNKLSLTKIRNILLKKGYIIDRKSPQTFGKNINNFLLVCVFAFLLIGFFSALPMVLKISNKYWGNLNFMQTIISWVFKQFLAVRPGGGLW